MEDWLQWLIAAACFVVTVSVKAEVALVFVVSGLIGILFYGSLFKGTASLPLVSAYPGAVLPFLGAAEQASSGSVLLNHLVFFLKAGAFTFGSGLAIVPFLQHGLVTEYGWLGEREFLIAVAVGMISPGPVVITATFVGYVVAGLWGSLASTVGIFLPSFLIVLIAAPIVARHRSNANLQGFIKGAYGAAIGTIVGACILLGEIAIGDWLTVVTGAVSLIVLFRWKVSNPLLITVTAIIGLVAFPLLQPAWVMVR